jgi:DNA integrity scanning protein DisA with diadenylate cyclase activity
MTAGFALSISAVDGAVVVTKKFEIIGFGAEIISDMSVHGIVRIVKDPMGKSFEEIHTTEFGMRHRSAMRFCSLSRDSLCFVMSQDGLVRAIRCLDDYVYITGKY